MEKQQRRLFNITSTSTRELEVYNIEPIATFLGHQCVNVVERNLEDPTHQQQLNSLKSPQYKKLTTHPSNCWNKNTAAYLFVLLKESKNQSYLP